MMLIYLTIFFLFLLFFAYPQWLKITRRYFYKKLAVRLAGTFFDDQRILDIGCGTGFFAEMMKNKIPGQIFCLDLYRHSTNKAPFIIADATHLPFLDRSFDTITLFYVLHHSTQPKKLLSEACRVSRGRIIIHEDVYTTLFEKTMYLFHIWSFKKFHHVPGEKIATESEWLQLFDEMNWTVAEKLPIKRLGYPVSRREYILISNNRTDNTSANNFDQTQACYPLEQHSTVRKANQRFLR